MSEVTEMLERAEHAGHGGGHEDSGGHAKPTNSKAVGLTMSMLGVLLAFCAAQVGGERTDLVKAMVEQTQAHSEEQSHSTRFRMLFSQLEQLRAIAPTDAQVHHLQADLDALRVRTSADEVDMVDGFRSVGVGVSTMLQPTSEPLAHLIGLVRTARYKTSLAHLLTESYDATIHAHFESAEHFEEAQLCAEIGIVLSSIALLLANRLAWYASMLLGLASAVVVSMTFVSLKSELVHAEAQIEHAKHLYDAAIIRSAGNHDDEDTLHALEAGMSPANLRVARPPGTDVPAGSEHVGEGAPAEAH